MLANEHRRFGIADALILTAGIAGGLGLLRFLDPTLTPEGIWNSFFNPKEGMSPNFAVEALAELGAMVGGPLLAAWTPACLAVQIIKPRPRWKRFRRQPGFAACILATLTSVASILVGLTCVWLFNWAPRRSGRDPYKMAYLVGLVAGSGVASSWAMMRICGVTRPQPTWTDRLGRLTGAAWVVNGVLIGTFLLQ